jgi:hypothetical protein
MFDPMSETMYQEALWRGLRNQLWSMLTRRPRRLLTLGRIDNACVVRSRRESGTRTVPLARICGSEGRAHDFDRDFNPLQEHSRERWLCIATARRRGRELPPVELIQVGELYFVRDGHHRISVARALGELAVEARVIVWQVSGPLPWDTATSKPTHGSTGQQFESVRAFEPAARSPVPDSLPI